MGTIIRFPKQCQDTTVNFHGLELFVESCGKLLNTLPTKHALLPDKSSTDWSKP